MVLKRLDLLKLLPTNVVTISTTDASMSLACQLLMKVKVSECIIYNELPTRIVF